ncbi:MAG: iron chelate uptake ABC transporter family permease subunit [Thermomicrobiales bacterium]|nr:iron chelate uptake ABC transporter family permease subunit [Thermomicrobiales bacterium]
MTLRPVKSIEPGIAASVVVVILLCFVSIAIGAYSLSVIDLVRGDAEFHDSMVMATSRIPRTLAIVLVGMSTSVCGLIMQMLARNKFASPTTAGTVPAASLGILTMALLVPGATMFMKVIVATLFALAGTAAFLLILRYSPMRSPLAVPLVGLMFGGVLGSIATFFAYRYDLLQSLSAWTEGDFSRVLKGRYELLWLSAALTVVAYTAADRFTVAGLGESFATNLGLNYRRVTVLGLVIVATITAVNVVTVGAIPFLGLIVPNVISLAIGDNVRRAVPYAAIGGAAFLLVCDIAGRLIRQPFEIPISAIAGVIGSMVFLFLLVREAPRGS